MREYRCKQYRCMAPDRCCLFCAHCTDVFYDSHGPYLFICDLGKVDWRSCECFADDGKDGNDETLST